MFVYEEPCADALGKKHLQSMWATAARVEHHQLLFEHARGMPQKFILNDTAKNVNDGLMLVLIGCLSIYNDQSVFEGIESSLETLMQLDMAGGRTLSLCSGCSRRSAKECLCTAEHPFAKVKVFGL